MNNYEKLLNDIAQNLVCINLEIEQITKEIKNNSTEIQKISTNRDNIESSIMKVGRKKYLLENYDIIIKECREFHIKKGILKTFIVTIFTFFGTAVLSELIPMTIPIIIGCLIEAGVITLQFNSYKERTTEINSIKDYYTITDLESYGQDLEQTNKKAAHEINSLIAREYTLKNRLDYLEDAKQKLLVAEGIINAKRDSLIMSLIHNNEEHFNKSFNKDEQVMAILKLERSLKNGENI